MRGKPVPSPFYRVSVKAIVLDRDGRLLVLQNRDHTWELPGGGWEHGETLEQCLRREIDEELGVAVSSLDDTLIHPCVGLAPGSRYPWLKLALAVALASQDFKLDERMQATSYMARDEFRMASMHRSDRCLQADAERLWEVGLRGRPGGGARAWRINRSGGCWSSGR